MTMIYNIKYWPDPFLKKVAERVDDLTEAEEICNNLFETMYDGKGIGLAATQCGIAQRIFVMDTEMDGEGIKKAYINPEIIEGQGSVMYPEGCLSFPNIYVNVDRYEKVRIRHTLLTGEDEDVMLEGLSAICAQHELDHLNGITFFDHMGPAKRQLAEKKARKMLKKLSKRNHQ